MKTLTATLAALAAVATLSAAPAMAENAAYEQRAKLERLLNMNDSKPDVFAKKATPRKTSQVISTTMPSGPEAALRRLLAVQPIAADGGR